MHVSEDLMYLTSCPYQIWLFVDLDFTNITSTQPHLLLLTFFIVTVLFTTGAPVHSGEPHCDEPQPARIACNGDTLQITVIGNTDQPFIDCLFSPPRPRCRLSLDGRLPQTCSDAQSSRGVCCPIASSLGAPSRRRSWGLERFPPALSTAPARVSARARPRCSRVPGAYAYLLLKSFYCLSSVAC